jgi:hypothetical protein
VNGLSGPVFREENVIYRILQKGHCHNFRIELRLVSPNAKGHNQAHLWFACIERFFNKMNREDPKITKKNVL